jgi:phage N-6-adenine-methyltransferase
VEIIMVHKRSDDIATPKGEWGTPEKLYRHLDKEFNFDADAAANANNTKHPVYFSKSMDSLRMDWKDAIETTKVRPAFFLNPDYAKGIIDKFVAKARLEARKSTVVCLLPVSTDTGWWNKHVMSYDRTVAVEIRFIEGRVHYVGYTKDGKQITQSPSFPSCIVIFCRSHPHYWNQDRKPVLPIIGETIVLRELK